MVAASVSRGLFGGGAAGVGAYLEPALLQHLRRRGAAGLPFTIQFRHSVQKTPVWENLQVEQDGSLTLLSTRYQSFGVGLPFLEGEGDFREEGDYFIFDHMNRHFPQLTLRTGVGTQLTLSVAGREYRLYNMYPPGTRVDLVVLPLWRLALWRPSGK